MRKILFLIALMLAAFTANVTAQITSPDNIDEAKVYTIVSGRAVLSQNGSSLVSKHDAASSDDYWAFVKYGGNYYLYSVAAKKFVQALPGYGSSLLDYSTSYLNFVSSSDSDYPICLRIARWGINTQTSNTVALNDYTSADAGNKFAIKEVAGESFDANTARQNLENAYSTLTGKIYTLSGDRGALTMTSGTLKPTGNGSNTSAYEQINPNNTYQQFAFVLYKSQLYIYNVGQDKFLYGTTGSITGRDYEGTTYNICYNPSTKAMMFTYGTDKTLNNNNSGSVNLDGWIHTDGGNNFTLNEVSTFDDTALMQKLNTADVTFTIEDTDGNVLGTRTAKVGVGTYTSAPTNNLIGINFFTTTLKGSLYTVEAGQTNTATLVATWNGPFNVSPSLDDNGEWYAFNVRNKNIGLVTDNGTMRVTTSYSLNDVLDNDVWAFYGNNISGFSIYNKKSGLYLTKPADNDDGTPCTLSSTPNTDWLVMPTANEGTNSNGSFLLYEKSNVAHKLNQYGGASASTLAYYNSDSDPGNFFYLSTTIDFVKDALVELYNTISTYSFGTELGQFNSTDPSLSIDDINSTLAGVNAVVNSTTATTYVYTSAYNALVELSEKIELNSPTAGFYRMKNVATEKYLYGKAESSYGSIDRYVYADGNNTSAATVIKLAENSGHLYIQNQGCEFGWVVADKSVGAGIGYLRSIGNDKYANWFPGKTAGQIAFGICYGNGTGDYVSYLKKGIYTVDTDQTVIGGTDYTSDAAQWIVEPATSISITMHAGESSYWATLYAPFGVTMPTGTEAYVGKINEGGNLQLTSIGQDVPAGTAVILCGDAESITATINDAIPAFTGENALQGQYLAADAADDTKLTLGQKDGKVGFYTIDSALGANKAYLTASAGAKGFQIVFSDDDITGIQEFESSEVRESECYYDLTGRKVATPQKGQLYIVNGKVVKY